MNEAVRAPLDELELLVGGEECRVVHDQFA
jgi:hypothetical protein